MQFVLIKSKIPIGYELEDLLALRRDTTPIDAIFLQPEEQITANEHGVKSENFEQTSQKFNKFIEEVILKNSDVVLVPEYFTPWETIKNNLIDKFPAKGKLWVIGAQSIKQTELSDIALELKNAGIEVIYEDTNFNPNGFLDPLCYLFWIKKINSAEYKKVLLIQFKTQHMGARTETVPIEQQNLVLGQNVYVFENSSMPTHRLFSLICSDVMAFNRLNLDIDIHENWIDGSFLILSLQLNPKPFHDEFALFRKKILQYNNKDIICVNYAINSKINGFKFIDCESSMYCLNSFEPECNEVHLNNLHNAGIYFHLREEQNYVYLFAPVDGLYALRLDRPSLSGAQRPISQKRGPNLIEYKIWCEENCAFQLIKLPNYFLEYLSSRGMNEVFEDLCFFNSERLISISLGEIPGEENWYELKKIKLLRVKSNDESQRITVVHNSGDIDEVRINKLGKLLRLKEIVLGEELFNELINFKKFIGSSKKVSFYKTGEKFNYKFNLIGEGSFATVAYLGHATTETANKKLSTFKKMFNDNKVKRIAIWYLFGNTLKVLAINEEPSFTDDDHVDDIAQE